MKRIINDYKTSVLGLVFLIWSAYNINRLGAIELESFESYYYGSLFIGGAVLLFSGDKYINKIIEIFINKLKKILE